MSLLVVATSDGWEEEEERMGGSLTAEGERGDGPLPADSLLGQ